MAPMRPEQWLAVALNDEFLQGYEDDDLSEPSETPTAKFIYIYVHPESDEPFQTWQDAYNQYRLLHYHSEPDHYGEVPPEVEDEFEPAEVEVDNDPEPDWALTAAQQAHRPLPVTEDVIILGNREIDRACVYIFALVLSVPSNGRCGNGECAEDSGMAINDVIDNVLNYGNDPVGKRIYKKFGSSYLKIRIRDKVTVNDGGATCSTDFLY
ncbi:hypothetical protein PHISCL_08594 [Aspergillus sclerotialis]|uniref:Uncharacterized protein n=1 Tax=Aspergillus sclerotialis TaxID=2070753 RepID=A0A3A2Z7K2_9EURO|nr:hypothetical protein PHISCL_08594 [Aspergillus sclerotialis]